MQPIRFLMVIAFVSGLILSGCQGTSKPEVLYIDSAQVTSIQYGEPNNSSEPTVFYSETPEDKAVIQKVVGWYNDASYEGAAPDSQLGIRTMGYPSLRIFTQDDDSSVFVNLVNKKVNVFHPSLQDPVSISSDELVDWMESGWEEDNE